MVCRRRACGRQRGRRRGAPHRQEDVAVRDVEGCRPLPSGRSRAATAAAAAVAMRVDCEAHWPGDVGGSRGRAEEPLAGHRAAAMATDARLAVLASRMPPQVCRRREAPRASPVVARDRRARASRSSSPRRLRRLLVGARPRGAWPRRAADVVRAAGRDRLLDSRRYREDAAASPGAVWRAEGPYRGGAAARLRHDRLRRPPRRRRGAASTRPGAAREDE
jgi:hypothetical protein